MAVGESLPLKVVLLAPRAAKGGSLYWRPLGKGEYREAPLTHVARAVYRVEIPPQGEDVSAIEYYVRATWDDGKTSVWPATAPSLQQTVVVHEPFGGRFWTDKNLNGRINEQQPTYRGLVTPAKFRAEYLGRNFGNWDQKAATAPNAKTYVSYYLRKDKETKPYGCDGATGPNVVFVVRNESDDRGECGCRWTGNRSGLIQRGRSRPRIWSIESVCA